MAILISSVIGIALTVAFVAWQRDLARAQRRPEPPRKPLWHYPSVSIIRPVRGADVGARENFEAALDTGYPGDVETLFVFDDESDPGLPIARDVVRAHNAGFRPGRASVVVAGAPPPARTGKLNAMIVGAARARGSLIAFGDSDTRPDRELLTRAGRDAHDHAARRLGLRPGRHRRRAARRRRRALRAHAERALRAARRARRRQIRRRAAVHHGTDHGVQARGARRHRRRAGRDRPARRRHVHRTQSRRRRLSQHPGQARAQGADGRPRPARVSARSIGAGWRSRATACRSGSPGRSGSSAAASSPRS